MSMASASDRSHGVGRFGTVQRGRLKEKTEKRRDGKGRRSAHRFHTEVFFVQGVGVADSRTHKPPMPMASAFCALNLTSHHTVDL